MQTSCLLITYNCAKSLQTVSRIKEIVRQPLGHEGSPQFIVFCLQEVAPILDASLGWTDEWLAPFTAAVPSNFSLVGKAVSGAVAVLAFAASDLEFKSVSYDTLAFGLMWSSLKGAAMLTIEFGSAQEKITFISAHLAANAGRKEQRNRDFAYLIDQFGVAELGGQVLIGGDLNYRTEDGKLGTDELSIEMRNGRAAKGFVEAPINFGPSFKFFPGSNNYNEKRTASFCDRVLYRALEGLRIIKYDEVMSADVESDHKPVFLVVSTPTNRQMDPMHVAGSEESSAASALLASPEENGAGDSASSARLNGSLEPRRTYGSGAARWEALTSAVDTTIGSSAYVLFKPAGRLGLGVTLGLLVFAFFVL